MSNEISQAKFSLSSFKCEKCNQFFDNDKKIPRVIPCGHTLCLYCLNSIWKSYYSIKCPFDSEKFYDDLSTYPVNWTIVDYINLLIKTDKEYLQQLKVRNDKIKKTCKEARQGHITLSKFDNTFTGRYMKTRLKVMNWLRLFKEYFFSAQILVIYLKILSNLFFNRDLNGEASESLMDPAEGAKKPSLIAKLTKRLNDALLGFKAFVRQCTMFVFKCIVITLAHYFLFRINFFLKFLIFILLINKSVHTILESKVILDKVKEMEFDFGTMNNNKIDNLQLKEYSNHHYMLIFNKLSSCIKSWFAMLVFLILDGFLIYVDFFPRLLFIFRYIGFIMILVVLDKLYDNVEYEDEDVN